MSINRRAVIGGIPLAAFCVQTGVGVRPASANYGEPRGHIVLSSCIGHKDTACVDVCPVDCIYGADEDTDQVFIHPDECIDCGLCVDACPVEAIFPPEEIPEGQAQPAFDKAMTYFNT